MNYRNVYCVWIRPEDVVTLFRGWDFQPGVIALPCLTAGRDPETGERVPIPPDTKVRSATYDWHRQSFGLLIEHPSFPKVLEGEEAPWLPLSEVRIEVREAKQEGGNGPLIVEAR